MSKYPCGICGIGVKYSSMACTGPCKQWFHGKCTGLSNSDLKRLLKAGYSTWKCKQCHTLPIPKQQEDLLGELDFPTDQVQDRTFDSPSLNLTQKMEDVHEKVISFQDGDDLESSLTLAAEVGNTLLAENKQLKNEIHNLTLINSKLTQLNNELRCKNEVKIEELESTQERLLLRNSSLLDTLNKVEQQLTNEKLLKEKLAQTFEALDREKEDILLSYENEIKQLKETINKFKKESENNLPTGYKTYTDSGTQTCDTGIIIPHSFYQPNVLDLTNIKGSSGSNGRVCESIARSTIKGHLYSKNSFFISEPS